MNRTRILHVLYRMGTGGTELALQRLLSGLDPGKFEHTVCTIAPFASVPQIAGVRYVSLERSSGNPGLLVWQFLRLFKAERPDIVHSRNWGAIEAVIAARFAGIPHVIHSEHGRDIHTMHGDPWRRRVFRRLCYTFADEVFAVSRELQEHYAAEIHVSTSRLKVIPNGVDSRRFRPDPEARKRMREQLGLGSDVIVLGTIGRLDPVKDHYTLLAASQRLLAQGVALRVVIVGDGPEHKALSEKIAASRRLRNAVTLAGESATPEDWLNSFDIFALPSLSEGMSNTLLEAMATGLPAIATHVGANPDLIDDGKTGFLVEVRRPEALANCALTLCADAKLRSLFGANARRRVESEFSFQQMLDRYSKLYTLPSAKPSTLHFVMGKV